MRFLSKYCILDSFADPDGYSISSKGFLPTVEDNGCLLQKSQVHTAAPSAPNPVAGHCQPTPLSESPGHSQASLYQSLVGSLLLSPESWCPQGFVCALQESVSPVLCKFWQFYGGVNGNLPQEALCHTQVCCIQSLCHCSRPLFTHPCSGDTQTQFWLSLRGTSGSCAHKFCLSPPNISGGCAV